MVGQRQRPCHQAMDTALDCGKVETLLFQVRMNFLTININIYAELKKPCRLVRYGNLRASFPPDLPGSCLF
ncbi:hypothetical protein FocTR4_00015350 [Fusarium oxysporum f. sp. cubense]|uniref:Uncharacterized protein n=1 Tax=Fusarium oxysporum f. sp. cubense TaxID=61366 RepID=A0A5C6SXM4_FUSOC|nr:hypothetical protein FocTR4_00015350 [Fusarium oxysporum f. sp. cubense]